MRLWEKTGVNLSNVLNKFDSNSQLIARSVQWDQCMASIGDF